jgi:uncharacterized membrane protein (DUF485 family)
MSKFNSSVEKREIWPGIVSVMVPLIQLTSVVVIGLSDTFHIAQLLIFPEILNIVHLLTMLVIVSGIGWFWYWRSNINSIIPIFDPKTKTVKPNQIIIEKINRFLVVFSVIFLLIFIFITIAGYKNLWGYSVLWGILQYIAYSLLLITTGFSIYIWIFEFIQKKQTFRREDFIRNLVLTLEEHGLIERAKFEILGNEMDRIRWSGLSRHGILKNQMVRIF